MHNAVNALLGPLPGPWKGPEQERTWNFDFVLWTANFFLLGRMKKKHRLEIGFPLVFLWFQHVSVFDYKNKRTQQIPVFPVHAGLLITDVSLTLGLAGITAHCNPSYTITHPFPSSLSVCLLVSLLTELQTGVFCFMQLIKVDRACGRDERAPMTHAEYSAAPCVPGFEF